MDNGWMDGIGVTKGENQSFGAMPLDSLVLRIWL